MPTTCGRAPTRAAGSGDGLVRFFNEAQLSRQEEFVAWQPSAAIGWPRGRVAAAGRLEGPPALPYHPRVRGRAARTCRAGPGAHGWLQAAGFGAERAGRYAVGHEERPLRMPTAIFPSRRRRAYLRQRPRGRHQARRAATWMSPETGQARCEAGRCRGAGIRIGRTIPADGRSKDPLGNLQRASDLAYRHALARLASLDCGNSLSAADRRCAPRVSAKRLRHVGRLAGGAQVRSRLV
jgi:hypothetical protein